MSKTNILLLFGGGGPEHEISRVSSNYIEELVSKKDLFNVIKVELQNLTNWQDRKGNDVFLSKGSLINQNNNVTPIHYVIPCFHGTPGETGEIQSTLEANSLPYLGSSMEASVLAFNKIATKLFCESVGLPIVPFTFVKDLDAGSKERAINFFREHQNVFVKPSHQGSSIGCTPVQAEEKLRAAIEEALKLSPNALIEKLIKATEVEVSVYSIGSELKVSYPGEIQVQSEFYSFEEKYEKESKAKIYHRAQSLSDEVVEKLKEYSRTAFQVFGLKDLARIDYFVTESEEVFLSEINTFPGMTPISLFPKMLVENGDSIEEFFHEKIQSQAKKVDL
ncbi:MAG: D-alanine--D-alanine ligase [Bacteriovoracaceae bacterium]